MYIGKVQWAVDGRVIPIPISYYFKPLIPAFSLWRRIQGELIGIGIISLIKAELISIFIVYTAC